jgi:hypothetical protein
MNSREMPHAAMNMLMQWVRLQGEQVISFQTWPQVKGWSTQPEWSVHLEMRSAQTLHTRIKPKGYRFAITLEPDPASCPACLARQKADQEALEQATIAAMSTLAEPSIATFACD